MFTVESAYGATYLKWNGITRFIWLPASPDGKPRIQVDWRKRILIVWVFGWYAIFAPMRPRKEAW